MNKTIALIRGDGIGPEIIEQAKKVLCKIGERYAHSFTFVETQMGGCAIDLFGEALDKKIGELTEERKPEKKNKKTPATIRKQKLK